MVPGVDGGPARHAVITHSANGDEWRFEDGTRVAHNPQGAVVRQVLPDGSVYSGFDNDGRPTDVVWSRVDGIQQLRADNTHTNAGDCEFDDDGRPMDAVLPGKDGEPGRHAVITYTAEGDTVDMLMTGPRCSMTPVVWWCGRCCRMIRCTPGLSTRAGRKDAVVPAVDGGSARHAVIKYSHSGDEWTVDDGTRIFHDSNGAVVREIVPNAPPLTSPTGGDGPRRGSWFRTGPVETLVRRR